MGQGSTKGSIKQFGVFTSAVPDSFLFQMRAGLTPSPYEENSLRNYYFLDAHDVAYNQEKVFNHATGSWEAVFLNIPSTTHVNKFVDPPVTTWQRYEELPSCSSLDGLYLDPVFLVCKRIEHYALAQDIFPTEMKLPLPELRDGGRSWTLSLWIYYGHEGPANIFSHQDSSSNVKLSL